MMSRLCLHTAYAPAAEQVDEMSPEAQQVIRRYCQEAGSGKYAPLCAVGATLPWSTPSLADFELLAKVWGPAGQLWLHGTALTCTVQAAWHCSEQPVLTVGWEQSSGLVCAWATMCACATHLLIGRLGSLAALG